jgi:hypothetical protein
MKAPASSVFAPFEDNDSVKAVFEASTLPPLKRLPIAPDNAAEVEGVVGNATVVVGGRVDVGGEFVVDAGIQKLVFDSC